MNVMYDLTEVVDATITKFGSRNPSPVEFMEWFANPGELLKSEEATSDINDAVKSYVLYHAIHSTRPNFEPITAFVIDPNVAGVAIAA
jgi:hypothetical protein